ncbi:MAG: 5-(carboxyamino)imidazole ribonucleotide synthase [Rhodospirillales bacterium]|nr:5-(carboxyamino)imidazole ribonucleotide synthase [Rhodospirillales bacterium]
MRDKPAGPLPPGAVIGILGGGQLGRMMAIAAARFGYRCHVFTPEADSPAAQVSAHAVVAGWDDDAALAAFAAECDVVTYEFENIPVMVAERLARHAPVRPDPAILAICQDRIAEKQFLSKIGVDTAPWQPVEVAASLVGADEAIGRPSVLKTSRLGYDGKGQAVIGRETDLALAWSDLVAGHDMAGIVEAWIDFSLEISVIVARSLSGTLATFVPVENQHEHHILRRTVAPAAIERSVASRADAIARHIAEALDLVGVLAAEMFVCADGNVLVNELAPRPHNSGHWTIDACAVSQFEQCVRAIAGLPLGPTERHSDAVMENLLGYEVERWPDLVRNSAARLHLYGKAEPRPGRKMGHVTWLSPRR